MLYKQVGPSLNSHGASFTEPDRQEHPSKFDAEYCVQPENIQEGISYHVLFNPNHRSLIHIRHAIDCASTSVPNPTHLLSLS